MKNGFMRLDLPTVPFRPQSRTDRFTSAQAPRLAYRLDMVELEASRSPEHCQILFRDFFQFS